jgi:hypothetical protein
MTSTPSRCSATARGSTSPSTKVARSSIRPSPSQSVSTAMRPLRASSPSPSTFGMKPRISTTHRRPSAPNAIATGSSTSGSLATSSMRRPSGSAKLACACA